MKVLFISYYWPPAGGVSVQRILHFVKNLSAQGVDCHVIHPSQASYYQVDETLAKLIPSEVTLHPVGIRDITSLIKKVPKLGAEGNIKSESKSPLTKLSKWIRANFFIPDPKVNWIKPVLAEATKLIQVEKFDLIFTNGTPHSVHLIGLELKKKFNLPWVADFRDPWTKMDYFESLPLSARSLAKHKKLESKVIKNADVTLTVSPQWKQDFEQIGATRVECITNGYDSVIRAQASKDEFIIGHVGSLHGDRSLEALLKAINLLIKHEAAAQRKIKLALVGNVSTTTKDLCTQSIGNERLLLPGVINHTEAKMWVAKSNALLLPINQSHDAAGRIPAKLFEYLSSGIPILVLGDTSGDAAQIVLQTKSGKCFNDTGIEEIYQFLLEILTEKWHRPKDKRLVEQYSRLDTAKELFSIFEELV